MDHTRQASIQTLHKLPFSGRATRKGTARLNAQLAAMFREEPSSTLPASASPSGNRIPASSIFAPPIVTGSGNDLNNMEVKALSLAKNFPFEIVCATTWGTRYLFGTPYGLYQLDKQGQLTRIVPDAKFTRITVIEEYGVLIAICGRHQHIRMYTLQDLYSKNQKQRRLLRREESFIKIKGTKYSTHYSIVRSKGAVFMVASIKTTIVLFMWADYPFNKFMKIKDFYAPEKVTRTFPILNADGKLSTLLVQCLSRYITVNVDTSTPSDVVLGEPKKSIPLLIHPVNGTEALVAFNRSGHIIDTVSLQPKNITLNWRFIPLAVVPLRGELILAFGSKVIDVFSKHTGEVVQTIRHKESKKIRFLFMQGEDVLVAARSMKTQHGVYTSNVYIMRAAPVETLPN